MELANIMLDVYGAGCHIIPKSDVTPSEVVVLRALHGNDAVTDLVITGEVNRMARAERIRLAQTYGTGVGEEAASPVVERLFPGAAPKMFETFAEIGIEEAPEVYDPTEETIVRKETRKRRKRGEDGAEGNSALD